MSLAASSSLDPIAADRVVVWTVTCRRPASREPEGWQWLDRFERKRARRFVFPEDRALFCATRSALRVILALQTRTGPQEVRFSQTRWGKPMLLGRDGAPSSFIHFNVSHSGGQALIAVAVSRHVGIDIEAISDAVDIDSVAERFFAPPEAQELRGYFGRERSLAFFRCFTRKEAYAKARGEGLRLPFDQFVVPVGAGDFGGRPRVRGHCSRLGDWSLFDIPTAPGYVGALAVQGSSPPQIEMRTFESTRGAIGRS